MAAITAVTGFGGSIYKAPQPRSQATNRGQKNYSKAEEVLSVTRAAGGLWQTELGGHNSPQQDLLLSLA
jgi:hypothetical protein